MKATVEQQSRPAAERPANQEFVSPVVNIFESQEGYVLEAEMPGVTKDGLEITLEGTEVTIVGHRLAQPSLGQALFRESREVDYRRVFELDPAIDTTKVSARIDQGILTLTLPKSERDKPRRIVVE